MVETGFYYLHENGDLIHKKFKPESDSPFVKYIWSYSTARREDAWRIVLEALALNARSSRIEELVERWGCTPEDLVEYMIRKKRPSELERQGLKIYIERFVGTSPKEWFDWLMSTPSGKKPDFSTMPRSFVGEE